MSQSWIAVIVPARDAGSTLERTLDALAAQQIDRPFEVIVVDDGSGDETAEIARRYEPLVRLICNKDSEGPGAARNRGAEVTRAGVLAFTDADCFPTPSWLATGVEWLAEADLVQGRVEPDPEVARTPFDRTLRVQGDRGFYQTANLLVRRETFDAVGGFTDWVLKARSARRWSTDRRRGRAMRTPIGEDTLFAWTACRQGARSAFAPDAVVHHAVVPGNLLDEVADRWHWARDMPGLARLVPEVRRGTFYRHLFFNQVTAWFDLALLSALGAALTRQKRWLIGATPYMRHVLGQASQWDLRRATCYVLGAPAVETVTLAGLLLGSFMWRCIVL